MKKYQGKGGNISNVKWTGFRWKLSRTDGNSDTHGHPDISCDKPILSYLFLARTRRKCCILLTENCSLCLHQTFSWKSHTSFFPASSKCPNPQNRLNLQEPGDPEAASAAASIFQLKLCLSRHQNNEEIPHFWAGQWNKTEKEIACTTRGGRLLPVSLLILG